MVTAGLRFNFHDKNRLLSKAVFLFLFCLFLSSCRTTQGEGIELTEYSGKEQTRSRFTLCSGYGCAFQSKIRLSGGEWRQVRALLPHSRDAEEERRKIAAAIAKLEQLAGQKSGTKNDKAGASVFGHSRDQMDCIDEAVNTSLYLRFLEADGLLTWHKTGNPIRRGHFTDGAWPHNTATIQEKKTGRLYAVDSWYGKNGAPPFIVPSDIWLSGWRPEGAFN
jgi:hypothetical protein